MSKWTLEKIVEQIKRGDTFSYKKCNNELVVSTNNRGFNFYDSRNNYLNGFSDLSNWHEFKFYRNGEEILPPKDRELIKFTEKLVNNVPRFVTDDNRTIYLFNSGIRRSRGISKGYVIEDIPNARVLYRYADTLEISHWGEK